MRLRQKDGKFKFNLATETKPRLACDSVRLSSMQRIELQPPIFNNDEDDRQGVNISAPGDRGGAVAESTHCSTREQRSVPSIHTTSTQLIHNSGSREPIPSSVFLRHQAHTVHIQATICKHKIKILLKKFSLLNYDIIMSPDI